MCLANRFRHLRHLVHCCLYFPLLFSLPFAPHAPSTRKKTAPLATVTTTWGSFLESPDDKRSRRAVVVYIQDRGINSFANNMIKLSARTRLFDLNTCIWFRARKVSETFEKRFPYLFHALHVFSDIISCFKSKKTSIVGWLLLTLRRDRLVNTRSRYSGWRWRQWSKTSQNPFLQLVHGGKNDV